MPNSNFIIRPSGAAALRSAEILIFGDIGESWYGESVAAKDFVQELAALDVDTITVRINSYGGSVSDGIAIHNAIRRHPATVTTSIEGVAASIASLIAMAGDHVEIAANALLMIHAPWSYAMGNSAELREYADMLDTWAEAMSVSYAAQTGRDKTEMLALLTDGEDHWFTAEQALAEGFVDSVTGALPIAASFNLSRFKPLPAALHGRGAFAAAAAPNQETFMPQVTPAAPNPNAATPDADAIRAAAVQAEAERRNTIRAAFEKFGNVDGVSALSQACQDDLNCTPEQANAKLLAHLGKNSAPVAGGFVSTVEDETDKKRAAASAALIARAGLGAQDTRNPYRGYTLYELARASLERAGFRTSGLDKMAVVAAAFTHTGSDFGNLLANVAEKAMLKGYEEAEETFQKWTVKGQLPDFKPARRVDLNTFPSLDKVPDGAEYKYATIGDRGETIQLATYGKLFGITRQGIINDDLDAFSKIPQRMGRGAIRTVGNLVYAVLTGNPTMSDGNALFHATHNNLLSGAALSTASVDAMRVAMAKQTDGAAAALNIRLANLLVPVALEGTAKVVRDSEFEVGAANRNNTTPNTVRGTFEVISDARLDLASATNWYGAASSATNDTIEVSYLDGIETPTLEQQGGWTIDGVEFKVRLDAGVKALDWRTLAKNPI